MRIAYVLNNSDDGVKYYEDKVKRFFNVLTLLCLLNSIFFHEMKHFFKAKLLTFLVHYRYRVQTFK